MPKKRQDTPRLKPSGYDAVIRNTLAMKAINGKLARASAPERDRLMTEKDRLMEEMWAACPHESVARCDEVRSSLYGPKDMATRLCTSCGFYEQPADGTFKVLKPKRGRRITLFTRDAFSAKLGEVLRRTGINAPSK